MSISRICALALALPLFACSSDNTNNAQDASVADTGPKPDSGRDPNKNCVKPGTPNNEVGVGGYCEPLTTDCVTDAGVSICTGTVGAPPDAWFCTKVCTDSSQCGSGMFCDHETMGSGCVPLTCGSPDAGAGDSGTDAAPKDAASD